MSISRTVKCDMPGCDTEYSEKSFGEGFPGWGGIRDKSPKEKEQIKKMLNDNFGWGIFKGRLKDNAEPYFCPECMDLLCSLIDLGKDKLLAIKKGLS